MHNLFVVYFVNLYMFRTYLGPSSGGTTVCIQHLVLIVLFRRLSVDQDNRESHLKRIIITNCCIHTVENPDDGPKYARNMSRLTNYTKNKLCIVLGFIYAMTSTYSCLVP